MLALLMAAAFASPILDLPELYTERGLVALGATWSAGPGWRSAPARPSQT